MTLERHGQGSKCSCLGGSEQMGGKEAKMGEDKVGSEVNWERGPICY